MFIYLSTMVHKKFTTNLIYWHNNFNNRQLAWKGEQDVYKIWLSEIILQQTRAEQGLPYYKAFINAYPTVTALANATNEAVFKLWEGLGYYSRCRNLLFTARLVRDAYQGEFPNNYAALLTLKGVGPYTAAAIASFGYNQAVAVVDGNVIRVLARYFGLHHTFNTAQGKKVFNTQASACLDAQNPATYNQAIMDFGATICKPKLPMCATCYLQKNCYAFKNNLQTVLPVKGKKIEIKNRYFNYIVATYKNKIIIKQRTQPDIWNQLYEFILLETPTALNALPFIQNTFYAGATQIGNTITQKLTHQKIDISFYQATLKKLPSGYLAVPKSELINYGFPISLKKFIDSFL